MTMTVLVTGGAGAVGRWLLPQLAERGATPVVYDAAEPPDGDWTFVAGDVTDLPAVLNGVKEHRPDVIVHLAAMLIHAGADSPYQAFRVNVGGMATIMDAARLGDVRRVVFASTKSVYGRITEPHNHPGYAPLPESYRLNPDDTYGYTKGAAEFVARSYADRYGTEFVALRFASMYGPGRSSHHTGVDLLDQIVLRVAAGRPVSVSQGGSQRNDFLYIKDAATALADAALTDGLRSPALNIGTGVGATLLDIREHLRELRADAEIEVGEGLDPFGTGKEKYSVFDTSLAKAEIGFAPAYAMSAALGEYLDTISAQ